jgi:hypothetical protein
MSDENRLGEYREYYRARAARYAADPNYPATAAAEQALSDAVSRASSMADLVHEVGVLALECGKALATDQANARASLYARTADPVRGQAPAEMLAGVGGVTDAAALAALGSAAEQRAGQAVAADELTRLWSAGLTALENVEAWQQARVPQRWRAELDGYAADALRSEREVWGQVVAEAQRHQAGWRFNQATASAERHRRLVPVPDGAFAARLSEHGRLVRVEQG